LIQFVFKKKAHKSIFKYKKGIKKKTKKNGQTHIGQTHMGQAHAFSLDKKA
jgi:hypothetical protein